MNVIFLVYEHLRSLLSSTMGKLKSLMVNLTNKMGHLGENTIVSLHFSGLRYILIVELLSESSSYNTANEIYFQTFRWPLTPSVV